MSGLLYAAERIASEIVIESDDLDEALAEFVRVYKSKHHRSPGVDEVGAAQAVLEKRLSGVVPPPPPSSSSVALELPREITGLPKRRKR